MVKVTVLLVVTATPAISFLPGRPGLFSGMKLHTAQAVSMLHKKSMPNQAPLSALIPCMGECASAGLAAICTLSHAALLKHTGLEHNQCLWQSAEAASPERVVGCSASGGLHTGERWIMLLPPDTAYVSQACFMRKKQLFNKICMCRKPGKARSCDGSLLKHAACYQSLPEEVEMTPLLAEGRQPQQGVVMAALLAEGRQAR